MHHTPDAERLLAHLRDHYGIDAVAATKLSVHKTYVFRVDRKDGAPWVARAFPPARPRAGVEGDAAILRFLARQDYPAERLAVVGDRGPIAINWKASGRGPRLADFAYLIWGTGAWSPRRPDDDRIAAAVNAYRRHIEPTDAELDRLEAVMHIRTLYLACYGYRRALAKGRPFTEWGFIEPPEYYAATAAATRAAFSG